MTPKNRDKVSMQSLHNSYMHEYPLSRAPKRKLIQVLPDQSEKDLGQLDALLVGVNNFTHLNPLSCAKNDVIAIREALKASFSDVNIQTIPDYENGETDEDATSERIHNAIKHLYDPNRSERVPFFGYFGKGIWGNSLATVDSPRMWTPRSAGVRLDFLIHSMKEFIQAKDTNALTWALLDCSFGGIDNSGIMGGSDMLYREREETVWDKSIDKQERDPKKYFEWIQKRIGETRELLEAVSNTPGAIILTTEVRGDLIGGGGLAFEMEFLGTKKGVIAESTENVLKRIPLRPDLSPLIRKRLKGLLGEIEGGIEDIANARMLSETQISKVYGMLSEDIWIIPNRK